MSSSGTIGSINLTWIPWRNPHDYFELSSNEWAIIGSKHGSAPNRNQSIC